MIISIAQDKFKTVSQEKHINEDNNYDSQNKPATVHQWRRIKKRINRPVFLLLDIELGKYEDQKLLFDYRTVSNEHEHIQPDVLSVCVFLREQQLKNAENR